ncbi:tRNA pseudouridine synthase B [Raoultella ornithinolytica]|nr:tRNA pseudouridine synthase B [Raoultella ornithinolytica]
MSRPRRRGRDVHGVLLLDKPQGASSNDVLQKVKRIYNANRAGHTGALDPLGNRHAADLSRGSHEVFPVSAGFR